MFNLFNDPAKSLKKCQASVLQNKKLQTGIDSLDAYFEHPLEKSSELSYREFSQQTLDNLRAQAPVRCGLVDQPALQIGRMLPFLIMIFRTVADNVEAPSEFQKDLKTKAFLAESFLLWSGKMAISRTDTMLILNYYPRSLVVSQAFGSFVNGIERGCSGQPDEKMKRKLRSLEEYFYAEPSFLLKHETGLRQLYKMIGGEPEKNLILIELDKTKNKYTVALDRMLLSAQPDVSEIIRNYVKQNRNGNAKKSLEELLETATGAEAERLYAEMLRLVCEILDNPDWEMDYNVIQAGLQFHPGRLFSGMTRVISKMPNRKLTMDKITAERTLRLSGEGLMLTHNASFRLAPTVAMIRAVGATLTVDNPAVANFMEFSGVDERIRKTLLALLGDHKAELARRLAAMRSSLATYINTHRSWNFYFDDLPMTQPSGKQFPDWTCPNGQISCFASRIDEYALAILACFRAGVDAHEDLRALTALKDSLSRNLNRLRAGEGISFPYMYEEFGNEFARNMSKCPPPSREACIEKEQYLLDQLVWMMEQFNAYSELAPEVREKIVALEDLIGVSKTKSKPSKKVLKQFPEMLDNDIESYTVKRLSEFQPAVTKDLRMFNQCRGFAIEIQNLTIGLIWVSSGISDNRMEAILSDLESRSLVHTKGVGPKAKRVAIACRTVLGL